MVLLLSLLACDDFLMRAPTGAGEASPVTHLTRLNRSQYDNTVRDLFGTSMRPSVDFPADDFVFGFDTIGEVLSVSPLHVELYQRAASELVDELYGMRQLPAERWVLQAETAEATGGADWETTAWMLFESDALWDRVFVPTDGTYTVATKAWTRGGAPGDVQLWVDGAMVIEATVVLETRVEHTLELAAGHHTLEVRYVHEPAEEADREELIVDWMEVTGPFGILAPPPAGRDRVLSCTPATEADEPACAAEIVRAFGRRAWRRPLTPAEVQDQLTVYGEARAQGGDFDAGMQAVLQALLVSPHFLYRVELDRGTGAVEPVSAYALASRLSYFLWSSMPDDRLLDLAETGLLLEPQVLEAEARRMLDDPRAQALVDNLGGQWLGIRKVAEAQPDPGLFPEADPALRRAMEAELSALVRSVFLEGAPLDDLLRSTTAVVDARLADHYGLDGPGVVDLPDRPGLLTRAGWLMATSHPTRTSPTKRGAWVLDKVLCAAPPPAPPGVPAIPEIAGESVIAQLEAHVSDPSCAGCHTLMDPIGIGLEHFDVLGRQRDQYDGGDPVIAVAEMTDGTGFDGAEELIPLLAGDPRMVDCAVVQTYTYSMGRAPTGMDLPVVDALTDDLRRSRSFRELLLGVVMSEPFRTRRGEP